MPYAHTELEQVKEALGFDAYVSRVIATKLRQGTRVSVELLTAEIRTRFNQRKMRALTDHPEQQQARPRTGFSSKFVAFAPHQDIEQLLRTLIEEYYKRQEAQDVRREQVRREARQLHAALGEAVTSIPLSRVGGPGNPD